ncbi:MAG: hypothetical protein WB014_01220 [Methanosarcina sp.]
MNRLQVFYLRIAVILLVMLSMLPALAVLTHEVDTILKNENNGTDFESIHNETELKDKEIGLNFSFLTSMLQILDLNLNLINGTLSSQVAEYPLLQPTIERMAHSSFEYPDGMIVAANSTLGEPDSTTPMIGDIYSKA